MVNKTVVRILAENDLKITPQRIAVLEVIISLNNHPTAENILEYLHLNFPHVAPGTVYKCLDLFVEKGIVKRVQTDKDTLRYDAVLEKHHHLYCVDSERIEDYYDKDLDMLIENYIKKKKIPNFKIEDIKVQIIGKFSNKNDNQ